MSMTRRHWKQRWDPDAELIFTRPMRIGEEDTGVMVPAGTLVDKVKHKKFLRRWWDAGLIAIRSWSPEIGRKMLQGAKDRRSAVPAVPPATAPAVRRKPTSNRQGD